MTSHEKCLMPQRNKIKSNKSLSVRGVLHDCELPVHAPGSWCWVVFEDFLKLLAYARDLTLVCTYLRQACSVVAWLS